MTDTEIRVYCYPWEVCHIGGRPAGSLGTSRGIYVHTHSSGSHAIELKTEEGFGVHIDSDGQGVGNAKPGIVINPGPDSASLVLNGAKASFDSSDFSPDWKVMAGRTPWYADTNNSAWNGVSTRFEYWNGKASSTTGFFESDHQKTYGIRVIDSTDGVFPIEGALVILYDVNLGEIPLQLFTYANGMVTCEVDPRKSYRAVVHKPGYTFPLAVSVGVMHSQVETIVKGVRDPDAAGSFGVHHPSRKSAVD